MARLQFQQRPAFQELGGGAKRSERPAEADLWAGFFSSRVRYKQIKEFISIARRKDARCAGTLYS